MYLLSRASSYSRKVLEDWCFEDDEIILIIELKIINVLFINYVNNPKWFMDIGILSFEDFFNIVMTEHNTDSNMSTHTYQIFY